MLFPLPNGGGACEYAGCTGAGLFIVFVAGGVTGSSKTPVSLVAAQIVTKSLACAVGVR